MHTIFETDSFVLKGTSQGEANKQLDLLTRDFGLIRATAQGLRYLKSKLRYSLTDFSMAHVSLVRGKEFWRVTTATKIADVSTDIENPAAREALYRIFALLRRLLQGEEPHPELFGMVENIFEILKTAPKENISPIEELSVLRTLYMLGYVKDDVEIRPFVESFDFDDEILLKAISERKGIVVEINRALAASHL